MLRGHKQFIHVEKITLREALKQRRRIDRIYAVGNVVTVEAVLLNPNHNYRLPKGEPEHEQERH